MVPTIDLGLGGAYLSRDADLVFEVLQLGQLRRYKAVPALVGKDLERLLQQWLQPAKDGPVVEFVQIIVQKLEHVLDTLGQGSPVEVDHGA